MSQQLVQAFEGYGRIGRLNQYKQTEFFWATLWETFTITIQGLWAFITRPFEMVLSVKENNPCRWSDEDRGIC